MVDQAGRALRELGIHKARVDIQTAAIGGST